MQYNTGDTIDQTWHPVFIFFAFVAALVSSYSAIRLLDHSVWVSEKEKNVATKVIIEHPYALASIILGSGTVWSMHFIGMSAVTLDYVPICYNWWITLGSLVAAVVFMWFGVLIASKDIFHGHDRLSHLKKIIKEKPSVTTKGQSSQATRVIHMVAFFHDPKWILLGSLSAAAGALIMHFTGMIAQQGPFRPKWKIGYLVLSVILGVAICAVGFWIIFRLLHWKVEKFWLRPASAAVIASAVCALHFFGMLSAEYVYDESLNGYCTDMLEKKELTPNAWTTHQIIDLAVALIVPTAALVVENIICRELMMAYTNLKDPNFSYNSLVRQSDSADNSGSRSIGVSALFTSLKKKYSRGSTSMRKSVPFNIKFDAVEEIRDEPKEDIETGPIPREEAPSPRHRRSMSF
mmetsp:Transcript_29220/g.44175  ORF Transcript_29220/g.44175 Transcript_29220/m.44175 type:complete len:405 (+) Transcript_29220:317-1531(+)